MLSQGEQASWIGIVCSGVLAAIIDGNVVGTMGSGKIVGEVAFFTGGTRMADVHGKEEGYMALIMMSHVVELFKNAPTTAITLVRALVTSSR